LVAHAIGIAQELEQGSGLRAGPCAEARLIQPQGDGNMMQQARSQLREVLLQLQHGRLQLRQLARSQIGAKQALPRRCRRIKRCFFSPDIELLTPIATRTGELFTKTGIATKLRRMNIF
jgi:hypothetical protein